MADFLTRDARSALMSRIKSKNTAIECRVFRMLRNLGVRFDRHVGMLPGSPDIAFPESRLAVFLDGHFWHGRDFNSRRRDLSPYWRAKISRNIRRDQATRRRLRRLGWRTLRLWEGEILKAPDACISRILGAL